MATEEMIEKDEWKREYERVYKLSTGNKECHIIHCGGGWYEAVTNDGSGGHGKKVFERKRRKTIEKMTLRILSRMSRSEWLLKS